MDLRQSRIRRAWSAGRNSLRQLKPLESVQFFLDAALQFLARVAFRALALADPIPFLQQELLVRPVGLEIERRDDVLSDQDRQCEIAELAFVLRHIGLEAVLVVEDEMRPLALDDQGIERREDVRELEPALPAIPHPPPSPPLP